MKTEYLYGIQPSELENKFYYEALAYKKEAGQRLLKALYLKDDRTEEEGVRLFFVQKAINHTQSLLDEREV